MASDSDVDPMYDKVRQFFNKVNEEPKLPCRLNAENLTEEQVNVFNQLDEFIKKRYLGTGLVIPEKLAGKRILDIGCGSGSLVFILSKLVGPDGYVVGIDLCDGLIETAKSHSEYHWKLWGYSKSNFEFHVGNVEKLDELGLQPDSFDLIVSNGVFCVVPNKESCFAQAYTVLKPGGQFLLNDVHVEKDQPAKAREDEVLWCKGAGGAMRWDTLSDLATDAGFKKPYLLQASPVNMSPEYSEKLENGRIVCAGWRLFKLPKEAHQGASRVTYKGTIPGFPDTFTWDVDLTFKNQNPFAYMDKLTAEGRPPEPIYTIE